MFLIRFIFILLFSVNICYADASFTLANDFFAAGNRDRWLTNDVNVSFDYDDLIFHIGNTMITPTDKRSNDIPVGDRNWDGHTYVGATKIYQLNELEQRRLTINLGVVGPNSGTDKLQKFVHNDLGFGTDPTWASQNPSEITIDTIYQHLSIDQVETFIGKGEVLSVYGARVGTVIDEVFISSEVRRSLNDVFFLFGGIKGRYVLYNTFLDGRLFRDNVYTVDKVPFVANTWLGLGVELGSFLIGYKYTYETEEFKGQDSRFLSGQLFIGKSW